MSRAHTEGAGLDRRQFLGRAAGLAGLVAVGGGLPAASALLTSQPAAAAAGGLRAASLAQAREQARAVVGDVVDFALTSKDWKGQFGFVTLRLHRGIVDGNGVYFIRTDASDKQFAKTEKLVYVPKLEPLADPGLSGAIYLVRGGADDQRPILSSEPGRDDYTPAWTVHDVLWRGGRTRRALTSVADVEQARDRGELAVERTKTVVNYPMVKWSTGQLPVDAERIGYLGSGQLLEEPDTIAMRVTFKLGQCYPGNRYFVVDHSMKPVADMTLTNFAPALHAGPTNAGATGRTNVFMNGLAGPGPMGFQPSAFDFKAGHVSWSPYWDHYLYQWRRPETARLLTSQKAVLKARDAGQLD